MVVRAVADRESTTAQPIELSAEEPPGPHTYWYVVERDGTDGTVDIDFQVAALGCPASHLALKNDVERALSTVNALYSTPRDARKRTEALAKLLALSRVGLVGRNASPDIATDALRAFESDVVNRESGPVKNAYMRTLGSWAGAFFAVAITGFFMCDLFPWLPPRQIVDNRNFLVLFGGCMVGTWVSFASRRVTLGFHDLVALEEDRIEPALRLFFSGILTIILGLIFTNGIANVEIGNFSASNLISSGSVALLTGALAGISEKALPSAILIRANDILPKKG